MSEFSAESPCISLCKLEQDVCVGCGRTKRDIGSWQSLTQEERAMVNQSAKARIAGHPPVLPIPTVGSA
jgi:predicted Fe-S protein YdhL (DUF1289 family)